MKLEGYLVYGSNMRSTALVISQKSSGVKHLCCSVGRCTAVLIDRMLVACAYAPASGQHFGEYEAFIKDFRNILYAGRRLGASSLYIAGNTEPGPTCADEGEAPCHFYGPQAWCGTYQDPGGFFQRPCGMGF